MRTNLIFLMLILANGVAFAKPIISVGSKTFTESYVLAEIIAQTIEDAGEADVKRRPGLGATGIAFESLKTGDIDLYPEYTGTISEAILKNPKLKSVKEINLALAPMGLAVSETLGFDDTYALAVRKAYAQEKQISNISDLKKFPDIRAGFTHEFLKRADGFGALTKFYGLTFKNYKGMEHSLAYESFAENKIDLVEVYSTDAKIARYDLQLLKDDRDFFPKYLGVLFFKKELLLKYPKTAAALRGLEGKISEAKMTELNAKVELDKWGFDKTAAYFLGKKFEEKSEYWPAFFKRTKEHLSLVFISLFIAVLIGLPLGVFASRNKPLAQVVLAVSGIFQTIPSLALLCFLIPFFGIGYTPAVVALFLYALLPIVRNTYLGFTGIDPRLIESAKTLGLSSTDRLFRIELPLASPAILSGIKLSAVINVGTATLAAFIGAGGYGAFIVTGLALNDTQIILQGAIPSAVLALVVQGLFEVIDFLVIPEGLKT
jgi:osmoprotectant transport system permease protein